jgi:hypothetical protein
MSSPSIHRAAGAITVVSALAAAALLFGAGPEVAVAACGGVKYAPPRHIDQRHRPPLAIGDSTMLLAVKPLARAGFEANARGCRPVYEGLDLLASRKRQRRLPKVVLMHLGLNAGITTRDIRRALRILGRRRILVLVTPRGGHDARIIRAAGRRWPRRVRVLDWVRVYQGHHEYFSEPHGLHLSQLGVRVFVRLCVKLVLPLNRRG